MQRVNFLSKESSADEIYLSLSSTLYKHCHNGDTGVVFFNDRFKLPYSKSDEVSSSDEVLTQLGCNLNGLYSLSDIAKQL